MIRWVGFVFLYLVCLVFSWYFFSLRLFVVCLSISVVHFESRKWEVYLCSNHLRNWFIAWNQKKSGSIIYFRPGKGFLLSSHSVSKQIEQKKFQQDRISRLFSMKIKFASKMLRMKRQINKVWNKQKEQITLWMLCKLVISAYLMLNNYRKFWKEKKCRKTHKQLTSFKMWHLIRVGVCHNVTYAENVIFRLCSWFPVENILNRQQPQNSTQQSYNENKCAFVMRVFYGKRALWTWTHTHTHIYFYGQRKVQLSQYHQRHALQC